MATVKDIPADKFIAALAVHLEKSKKFDLPKNIDIIKSGPARELAPLDHKWYYVRLAAVFRRVYLFNGIGAGALSRVFGSSGLTKNGLRKSHQVNASRGVIRHALKALEKAKFISQKTGANGRFITNAGRRELDTLANTLA